MRTEDSYPDRVSSWVDALPPLAATNAAASPEQTTLQLATNLYKAASTFSLKPRRTICTSISIPYSNFTMERIKNITIVRDFMVKL